MFKRFVNELGHLLRNDTSPTSLASDVATQPVPARGVEAGLDVMRPRVLLLIFDPIIEAEGGARLSRLLGWNDSEVLARQYAADLALSSGGLLQYQIVGRQQIDALPTKIDGFRYTDASFLQAWRRRSGFHDPDGLDYVRLIAEFDLDRRVAQGEIDEVWLFGPPYMGCWESTMVGPRSFWCNSNPVAFSNCPKRYVIMGFNYERDVGCMLENFGHRTESIMQKVYERHGSERNMWERFCRYDKIAPGRAECGNVHFAPNSLSDYDWGNRRPVLSRCDTWYRFPDLSGPPRTVTAADWGNGDMRGHHIWWFDRLPRVPGTTDGVANNWWPYIVDPNTVP